MQKKIVVAGGSGFIGNYFHKKFSAEGYEVIIVSRSGEVNWNDESSLIRALEHSEVVINLAGKSINCRFTANNKNLILNSRISTTKKLGEAISKCVAPPKLWLNASTAAVYRFNGERPNTEEDRQDGMGFLAEVGKKWEETFFSQKRSDVRQIALRITLVLGKDGGVFPVYKNLVRFGMGGKQGSGKQMFSWIHIEDFYQLICFLNSHEAIQGAVNCCAPQAVSNSEFMRTMRSAMNMPFGLPAMEWMLKVGSALIGTEAELILDNRWVIPKKMMDAGFAFQHPILKNAVTDLLHT